MPNRVTEFSLFGDSSAISPVTEKSETAPNRLQRTIPKLPDDKIANEYQLAKLLDTGVYHVHDLMKLVEQAGLASRDDGYAKIANRSTKYQHRVHGALQYLKKQGLAEPYGDGLWYITGTKQKPARATFVIMGNAAEINLALGAAADIAAKLDEPIDLILCDPPWQLGVGNKGAFGPHGRSMRGRDHSLVLDGYEEVPPDVDYLEFSMDWMKPASNLLRPGGYMAVVTAPQQASDVQRAGKELGLRFHNSLVVTKQHFVPMARTRFATSHIRVTVMSSGPQRAPRTFNRLPEYGKTVSGLPYPQDVITHIPNYSRRGLLRNSNQMSPVLIDEMVRTYSNEGDLVADFFSGGGTTSLVCLLRNRRSFSSDKNPEAMRFTMGRILDVYQQQRSMLDLGNGVRDFHRLQSSAGLV